MCNNVRGKKRKAITTYDYVKARCFWYTAHIVKNNSHSCCFYPPVLLEYEKQLLSSSICSMLVNSTLDLVRHHVTRSSACIFKSNAYQSLTVACSTRWLISRYLCYNKAKAPKAQVYQTAIVVCGKSLKILISLVHHSECTTVTVLIARGRAAAVAVNVMILLVISIRLPAWCLFNQDIFFPTLVSALILKQQLIACQYKQMNKRIGTTERFKWTKGGTCGGEE